MVTQKSKTAPGVRYNKNSHTQSTRETFWYDWQTVPVIIDVPLMCQLLGISDATAKKMLQSGEIKGFKVGQAWRINRAEVMRFAGVEGSV